MLASLSSVGARDFSFNAEGTASGRSALGSDSFHLEPQLKSTALVRDGVPGHDAATATPEPRSWALVAAGFGALGFILRWRRLA